MRNVEEQLETGVVFERAGNIRRALEYYQAAAENTTDPALKARALRHQSDVYRIRCDWTAALEAARESASTAKFAGLEELFAEARNTEAAVHYRRGDFEAAVPLFEEVLSITRDDRIRGLALQNLGSMAAMRKDFDSARTWILESIECFRRAGYLRGEVIALNNCAAIYNDMGDFSRAQALSEQAIVAAKRLQDFEALAHASLNSARALVGLDRIAAAEELISTALGYFTIEENDHGRVACLRILGDLNHRQDHPQLAIRCFDHALRIASRIGASSEVAELEARLVELGHPGVSVVAEA